MAFLKTCQHVLQLVARALGEACCHAWGEAAHSTAASGGSNQGWGAWMVLWVVQVVLWRRVGMLGDWETSALSGAS